MNGGEARYCGGCERSFEIDREALGDDIYCPYCGYHI